MRLKSASPHWLRSVTACVVLGLSTLTLADPDPVQVFSDAFEGPLDNVEIRDNWLNGGNYTIYCNGTNIRVSGNRFGRDYRYGIRNNCSGPDTQWTNNVWDDTGEAIPWFS